jgi:hypothetical protein
MMQTLRIIAIAVVVILGIAAVKTVVPNAEASKPCLLGYKAVCSFAPISTAILAAAAVGAFVLARNVILG